MNVLVTGGGGFLGLYLVERLVERGDAVRVVCRGRYEALDALGVESMQGDVRDADAMNAACAGIDTVFHTAALPGIWGPWDEFYGVNTQGTLNLLEASRRNGVGRFVYTSSPSVVFDGSDHVNADESLPYPKRYLCHYPHTKALAEKAVLEANGSEGLLTTALRPHLIWGPRDNHLLPRLVRRAQSGRLRRVGDGRNMISMAYVENAAHAHLLAADALTEGSRVAGRAYFINEPEAVNQWEWVNRLLALAGLPPVRKSISARAAYAAGAVCEAFYTALRLRSEPPMTRFLAAQLSQTHTYSIAAAQRDFGYEPIVSVEEGLCRTVVRGVSCEGREL